MNYRKLHNGKLSLQRPPKNQTDLLKKLYGVHSKGCACLSGGECDCRDTVQKPSSAAEVPPEDYKSHRDSPGTAQEKASGLAVSDSQTCRVFYGNHFPP